MTRRSRAVQPPQTARPGLSDQADQEPLDCAAPQVRPEQLGSLGLLDWPAVLVRLVSLARLAPLVRPTPLVWLAVLVRLAPLVRLVLLVERVRLIPVDRLARLTSLTPLNPLIRLVGRLCRVGCREPTRPPGRTTRGGRHGLAGEPASADPQRPLGPALASVTASIQASAATADQWSARRQTAAHEMPIGRRQLAGRSRLAMASRGSVPNGCRTIGQVLPPASTKGQAATRNLTARVGGPVAGSGPSRGCPAGCLF